MAKPVVVELSTDDLTLIIYSIEETMLRMVPEARMPYIITLNRMKGLLPVLPSADGVSQGPETPQASQGPEAGNPG